MKFMALFFLFVSLTVSAADQGALIANSRDSWVERSIEQLKAYCKSVGIPQQNDYAYICHLQAKADCEKKKPKACDVLKQTQELERMALQTDAAVEMVKPSPIYSTREKAEESTLTYNIDYGSNRPSPKDPPELREQLQKLEEMKKKLNPTKVRLDCDSDDQCKLLHYGVKGCGGPMGTIVYSTKSTDLLHLQQVESFTALDKKIQDQWSEKLGWGSTCEYLGLTGKLVCRRDVCEFN